MSEQQEASGEDERDQADDHPSVLQWVIAGASALLIVGVIGFTTYEALVATGSPPVVVVEVQHVEAVPGGYRVEIRAYNEGSITASGVSVEGELPQDSGPPEKSQTTIDYVPAKGYRHAGLFFKRDPRAKNFSVHATGYELP